MRRIISTTFRPHKQTEIFFCEDPFITKGEHIIVETSQGLALTQVLTFLKTLPTGTDPSTISTVIRKATKQDLDNFNKNKQVAQAAFKFCKSRIREHQLPMKLIDVEIVLDHSKFIFYFTAPDRIDFRDVVKDLVREYHAKIELRQVGERHETQLIGSIGNCGMICCCRRFIKNFTPVSIKMAKEQNVFLNPTKISGSCGKLLCCLSYEQENYHNFSQHSPKIGKRYQTTKGHVKIIRTNMFQNTVTILNSSNEELEITLEEWETLQPNRIEPQQKNRGITSQKSKEVSSHTPHSNVLSTVETLERKQIDSSVC